jgi:hypothetical protein
VFVPRLQKTSRPSGSLHILRNVPADSAFAGTADPAELEARAQRPSGEERAASCTSSGKGEFSRSFRASWRRLAASSRRTAKQRLGPPEDGNRRYVPPKVQPPGPRRPIPE